MSRVKTGNENGSEGARRIRRSNRFRTTASGVLRRRFNRLQLYGGNRDVFKRFPDCSSTGDGFSNEVSAPLHENSRLCSLNTRTSKCQVMGMIVLKSYIRGEKKKERRDSALQGGFWISTLPRLMLRKRVTKEMAGVGGWGQRSKVSEQ